MVANALFATAPKVSAASLVFAENPITTLLLHQG